MNDIFNLEKNPNLPMEELTAMLEEFRKCGPLPSSERPGRPHGPASQHGAHAFALPPYQWRRNRGVPRRRRSGARDVAARD